VVLPLELRLSTASTTGRFYRQHDRTVIGSLPLAELHEGGGDKGKQLGMPRSCFGLLNGKVECHSGQCYP